MKRTLIHAPLALFLALLFGVGSGVEALGLTGCPHHGAGGDHAGEMAHGSAPAEHDADAPHDAAPCLCFGACQAVGALPVVDVATGIVRSGPTVVLLVLDPTREAPRFVIPHVLPLANAPPLT